ANARLFQSDFVPKLFAGYSPGHKFLALAAAPRTLRGMCRRETTPAPRRMRAFAGVCFLLVTLCGFAPLRARAGGVTEFVIPTLGAYPGSVTLGPDGAFWFPEFYGNKIGRVTTNGNFLEFPLTNANAGPSAMALGPDGNLWFTEPGSVPGSAI